METQFLEHMYNHIVNNIEDYLRDDDIRAALDPKTNKTTRNLIELHNDELKAYTESLFITYATLYSVVCQKIDIHTE